MFTVEVRLPDDQLKALADMLAAKLGKVKDVYTPKEFAAKFGVDESTIRRRVKAGLIGCVPNIGKVLIPDTELQRLLNDPGSSKG